MVKSKRLTPLTSLRFIMYFSYSECSGASYFAHKCLLMAAAPLGYGILSWFSLICSGKHFLSILTSFYASRYLLTISVRASSLVSTHDGITWYLSLCAWPTSQDIMSSKLMCSVVKHRISFFHDWIISLVYVYLVFVMYSSADGHISQFMPWLLWIVWPGSTGFSLTHCFHLFLKTYPEIGLLGHVIEVVWCLEKLLCCFPEWLHWFTRPPPHRVFHSVYTDLHSLSPRHQQHSPLHVSSTATCVWVASHCGLLPWGWVTWRAFYTLGPFLSSWENVHSDNWPLLKN